MQHVIPAEISPCIIGLVNIVEPVETTDSSIIKIGMTFTFPSEAATVYDACSQPRVMREILVGEVFPKVSPEMRVR